MENVCIISKATCYIRDTLLTKNIMRAHIEASVPVKVSRRPTVWRIAKEAQTNCTAHHMTSGLWKSNQCTLRRCTLTAIMRLLVSSRYTCKCIMTINAFHIHIYIKQFNRLPDSHPTKHTSLSANLVFIFLTPVWVWCYYRKEVKHRGFTLSWQAKDRNFNWHSTPKKATHSGSKQMWKDWRGRGKTLRSSLMFCPPSLWL